MTTTSSHNTTRTIALQIKAASVAAIGFALMIGLGSHPATDLPLRWFGDLLFWPLGDRAAVLGDEARLVAAILGGIMTGFGLMIWMLTDALIDSDPKLLRRVIVTVMAVWFVVDSTGSVAAGAPLNVVGNLGFLALFVIPARRL